MLAESIAREKKELMVREKAQQKVQYKFELWFFEIFANLK